MYLLITNVILLFGGHWASDSIAVSVVGVTVVVDASAVGVGTVFVKNALGTEVSELVTGVEFGADEVDGLDWVVPDDSKMSF